MLRYVVSIVCAVALVSCGSRNDQSNQSPGGTEPDPAKVYGQGPDPKGSARYQSDVVTIGGGPRAIRAVSADGFTWIVDRNAPGASTLAVGKIMLATSRATGRVLRIEDRPEGLSVTLGPASLTEIVRDANIKFDLPIDWNSIVAESWSDPVAPGGERVLARSAPSPTGVMKVAAIGEWSDGELLLQAAPLRLRVASGYGLIAAANSDAGGGRRVTEKSEKEKMKKDTIKAKGSVSAGPLEVEVSLKSEDNDQKQAFALAVSRKAAEEKLGDTSGGLKVAAELSLVTRKFHVHAALPISDGVLDKSASFTVEGIEELRIGLLTGSENGLADNLKIRVEIPIEIVGDIPAASTGGVPLAFQFKMKFLMTTAFSSKNSTLVAQGRYGLNGPIGFEESTIKTPEFRVIQSLLDSMTGVSIGATGFVFAAEYRFMIGIGTKSAMAGPYVKVTPAYGTTLGSALGLVRCKSATLAVDAAGGVGAVVSTEITGFLEKIVGKKIKSSVDLAEVSVRVVDRTAVTPDVPLCR